MDDSQTLRSMVRDDTYQVVRVLSDGPSGRTELVTLDGEGPLVRKSIPLALANAAAWAAVMDIDEPLLPHIESLYRLPDRLVVVYEYVPGSSLRELVKDAGPFSDQEAASIICDVCHAASVLHARGVVHRDIAPGNVIVCDGAAHLVDLGIARQHDSNAQRDTTTLGTWGFAAPEQFGFAQTDARSDVYAIGRLLGYLLTGEQPETEAYEQALSDGTRVRHQLAMVVGKASSFEPSQRYQSAEQLADAVRGAMAVSAGGTSDSAAWPGEQSWQQSSTGAEWRDGSQEHDQSGAGGMRTGPNSASPNGQSLQGTAETTGAEYGPRLFRATPIPLCIFDVIVWVCVVVWVILMAAVAFAPLYEGKAYWTASGYGVAVITGASAIAFGIETHRLVTLAGPYVQPVGRLRCYLKRFCIIVVITCAFLFVDMILVP